MQTLSQLIANEIFQLKEHINIKELRVRCQIKKALMDLEDEYVRLAKKNNEDQENEFISENKPDIVDQVYIVNVDIHSNEIFIDNQFFSRDFYSVFSDGVVENRIEMYTNYKVHEAQ